MLVVWRVDNCGARLYGRSVGKYAEVVVSGFFRVMEGLGLYYSIGFFEEFVGCVGTLTRGAFEVGVVMSL